MPIAPNLEREHPHLSLETIAGEITPNREHQDELCKRARFHYENPSCFSFRRSFQKKDGRSILRQWFRHWNDSLVSGKDHNNFWFNLSHFA